MKKGRRIIALFLAVLMISMADSNIYQVFADEAVSGTGSKTGVQTDEEKETQADEGAETTVPDENDKEEAPAADANEQTELPDNENNAMMTVPQPQEAAAVPAAEGDRTFDMEDSVEGTQGTGGENWLYAGDTYVYKLRYTIPPLETGGDFLNPQIQIIIPENVTVRLTPQGVPDVSGQDVASAMIRQEGKYLYINLNKKLDTGTAKDITIGLATTNFKMTNGTKIKLSPIFNAQANGQKVIGSIPENKQTEVTVKTDDGWKVTKSVGNVIKTDAAYQIPYTLEVQNTNSSGVANWNRTGRLDMEQFTLTDNLPTNYPQGGGAEKVISVSMGAQELVKDTDYTVNMNTDGSIKSIAIHKINKVTKDQESEYQFVTAGTPITTKYTIQLQYPRTPYITASDEEVVNYHTLTNTAVLDYKLLGEAPKTQTADASVKLGEKEGASNPQKIVVQKMIQMGDRVFPAGNSAREYGTAEFGLYKDTKGTLANNIDGTAVAGTPRETDGKGTVTFSNLRSGTYYLKETEFLKGFDAVYSDVSAEKDKYIAINVKNNIVSLETGYSGPYQVSIKDNQVQVINTTSKLGEVEFYKHGIDPDGIDKELEGVTFQLVKKGEAATVYSATSDSKGLVSFRAIPTGTYILKENSVGGNSDYEISKKEVEVTVTANTITKPVLDGPDSSGNAVFMNVSPKGKLQIKKIEEKLRPDSGAIGLAGAQFELYGPYSSETTTIPDDAVPVKDNKGNTYKLETGADGLATSMALKEGWYILKEVKAPDGYVINPEYERTAVLVKRNRTNGTNGTNVVPVEIQNEKKISLTIKKTGVLGSQLYEEQLAGAVFNIYDAQTGGTMLGTLTTYLDDTHASTSNVLELKEGIYWYEEMIAPAGYEKIAGRVKFELKKNDSNTWQLKIQNTASDGQLRIEKKDSHTKEGYPYNPLPGVTFGLYTDKECKKPYLKSMRPVVMVTGEDGVALSPLLPHTAEDTYYVKEISAPAGYQISDKVYGPYNVTKNAQTLVNGGPILNDKQVKITLKKIDSKTGGLLSGAGFSLYETKESKNPIASGTTGADGMCSFTGLKPNTTYWYEETKVPADYVADNKRTEITTPDYAGTGITEATPIDVRNERKAKLILHKTSDMDGNGTTVNMSGVQFTIYEVDKGAPFFEGTAKVFGITNVTDAQGITSISGLNPGKDYHAKEILPDKEAGGYSPSIIGPLKMEAGLNQGNGYDTEITEVENKAVKGKIQIEKISSIRTSEGVVIPVGAVFDIYQGRHNNASDLIGQTPVDKQLETNRESGLATSGWLDPGEYTLKEVSVVGDYTLSNQLYHVTVEKAKTNKVWTGDNAIKNVPKGRIGINKKAVFNVAGDTTGLTSEYDLSGMKFEIYRKVSDNAEADMTSENLVDIPKESMTSGKFTSKALDAGDYWVKEIVPEAYKEQYDPIDPLEVKVIPGGMVFAKNHGANSDSVLNQSKYGKIRLSKRDVDSKVLLDKAEFELYVKVSSAAESDTTLTIDGNPVYLKKVQGAANSSDGGGSKLVSGTSGEGQAVTTGLAPGTYYLKEVKAPGEYQIINEWTGPIEVKKGEEARTDIFNYKPKAQEGTKKDSHGRPVQGAYIGVFETKSEAEAMKQWLAGQKVGTGTEDYNGIAAKIKTQAFRTEHKIISYGVSDAAGAFKFNPALTPTKTYFIMELLPPVKYLWNETIIEKKVADDGSFGNDPLVIENALGSQLKVYKYTNLSGQKTAVEGVHFNVYKANASDSGVYEDEESGSKYNKASETPVATGVSDVDGIYITIYLPVGTYLIEEQKEGMPGSVEYVETAKNYKIVGITNDGDIRNKDSNNDAEFYNPSKWAKFYVKKVDAANVNTALAATFEVYKKGEDGTYSPYKVSGAATYSITTKTNGTYTESTFLEPGWYQLRETKAPDNYTKITKPISFEIKAGDATYIKYGDTAVNEDAEVTNDVVTNIKQGTLALEKYGYYQEKDTETLVDGVPLAGAKFSLYKKLTSDSKEDCKPENLITIDGKTEFTTGADGKLKISHIDAGDYWLVETATGNENKYPLAGQAEADRIKAIHIDAGADNTSLTGAGKIKNITAHGKVKVKKIDAITITETPLAGAIFTVYTDAGCNNKLTVDGKDVILTTAADGTAVSVPIPSGNYWMKETKAPAGYAVDSNAVQAFTVKEKQTTGLNAPLLFKNGKNFKLQVIKSAPGGKLLPGAEFALYATKAEAEKATASQPGAYLDKGTTDNQGSWITTKALAMLSDSQTYYLKELKTPSGYAVPDNDAAIRTVTITYDMVKNENTPVISTADTKVENLPLGNLRLEKKGRWQGETEAAQKEIPLAGVKFDLYQVTGDKVSHASGAVVAATLTTDESGFADGPQNGLTAGWYEVVERVPEGYAKTESRWVQIKNNEINTALTGSGAIQNYPDKGNFTLYKYDGSKDSQGTRTGLAGAEFKLYKKNQDTGRYEPYGGAGGSSFIMSTATYTSGMLEPGDYQVIETKAPHPYEYTVDGTQYSIQFAVDETPIPFTIKAGTTIRAEAYNSPKGAIKLIKKGDAYNNNELLDNASFQLLDKNKTPIVGTTIIGGTGGLYKWENVEPGTYFIKELDSRALKEQGYTINPELIEVVVPAGKLVTQVSKPDDLTIFKDMTDASDKGRLRILKRGETDAEKLTGAVFEIYEKKADGTWAETPIDTVTVGQTEGTLSKLLPASPAGIDYLVKEIKAPDGYSLDDTLDGYPLKQEVKVYPYHTPTSVQTDNVYISRNKKISSVGGFTAGINKSIRENPQDTSADEVDYAEKTTASESLLLKDYTVDYKIDGFTDGKNEVGAKTFVITDNDLSFWYYDKGGVPQKLDISTPGSHVDYQMNSLQILPAKNADSNKKVGAVVYVQYTQEQKKNNEWKKLDTRENLDDLTSEKTLDLTNADPVVGIKVAYQNVEKGFVSEGVVINTTFPERGGWSTNKDPEVREIWNTAALSWEDKRAGADGKPDTDKGAVTSSEVISYIPTYTAVVPQVNIKNEVTSTKATYYAGDGVDYRITATHNEVNDEKEVMFKQAVISTKLPAFTKLDEQRGTNGFTVYRVSNGVKNVISPNLYRLTKKDATASLNSNDPGGESTDADREDLNAVLYTFEFAEDPLTTLAEGEAIVIEYSGIVSYDRTKDVGKLVSPAYLSSNALVPKSLENPKGLSFMPADEQGQPLLENKDSGIIKDVVEKDLSYLNDTVSVPIADSTSVRLLKEVSADGRNYSSTATAKVNPDGTIYYKITLYNLSTDKVMQASIVDVLPYKEDTYIVPSGGTTYERRKTNIPLEPGYEPLTYQEITGGQGGRATFYYYNGPWVNDQNRIGMLYDSTNMSKWSTLGWSDSASANTSAVGAQIDFGADGLDPGKSYVLNLKVKAPGYTADKIEEYNGKLMANSAAAAVVRSNTGSTGTSIGLDDRVEPNQVLATMALPTGSIGDYVWFDENSDGIQGDKVAEPPIPDVEVQLWQTRYYTVASGAGNEIRSESRKIATDTTDQDGKYGFANLPCDYLKKGASQGSENPEDYIGGEYYRYTVKFAVPDGYSRTLDNIGDDREKDANIISVRDGIGETAPVALSVQERTDGSLTGQTDLSIDAGFIKSYSLGDRVWLDWNQDGLQNEGEKGIAGASVSLYRVDGPDGTITEGQGFVARTITDNKGDYKFTDLPKGYYIVRFDISSLRKTGGYAYQYDFTKAGTSSFINNNDSDAKNLVDLDGRIRDTAVINLSEEGMNGLPGEDKEKRYDPRWDAGLVVYSAISGFCFDDQDYDDVQGLMIPLSGTKVELYEVGADGKPSEKPVDTCEVGSNGRYFFDHLTFAGDSQKYQLKFTYPEGYLGVDADAGSDDTKDSDVDVFDTKDGRENRNVGYISEVTVEKDSILEHCDAGARRYAAIGDYIWVDANRNGIQDAAERAVSGIRVVLQKRVDDNGQWIYDQETKTDDKGKYLFTGLESSEYINTQYRVVFAFDRFTEVTVTNAGNNPEADSDAIGTYLDNIIPPIKDGDPSTGGFVTTYIKPGYGMTDLTWDAGIIHEKVSVGDYVWYDDNYDGIQQQDEKGVPGVPVRLQYNPTGDVNNEAAWVLSSETETDANGYYQFAGLNPGYYRILFKVPDGYRATRYNRGTGTDGNAVDSDAARGIGDGWYVSRDFYLETDDMTWDAGIYKPQLRTQINRIPRTIDRVVNRERNLPRRRVRTGDERNILLWAGLSAAALLGGGTVLYKKRKTRRKENEEE